MGFLSRGQKKHLRQRKQHMKKAWRGEMDICGAVRVINKGETDLGRVFALIITFFWIFLKLLSFSQWSHILINTLTKDVCTCQSVSQFSHSFMSHFLRPHGLQHARPPCPSPTPTVTHTHVHWVGDAIQPSHPLLSPSPPTFNLSQHQGLFKWVSSLHQVAKGLEFQLQHQPFKWIFRTDLL